MSTDGAPSATTPGGSEQTPPAGTGTSAATSQEDTQGTDHQSTAEEQGGEQQPDAVAEQLRKYRSENKGLRDRLKALEDQQRQQAEASKPEAERLQTLERTVTAQQDRLRQGEVRYAVALHSAKMGIVDPEAAYRLLDSDEIDFDDKDRPTNVEAALQNLVRARPWLAPSGVRRGSADGGAGGAAPSKVGMNELLRAATGRGPASRQ